MDQPLHDLAHALGVITFYHDIDGNPRLASEAALVEVLRALGAPLERTGDAADALRAMRAAEPAVRVPAVHVVREGESPAVPVHGLVAARAQLSLEREDGSREEWTGDGYPAPGPRGPATFFPIGADLPWGIHRLDIDTGTDSLRTTILHAPRLAPAPADPRTWGVFAPLHSFGDRRTADVANYSDLGQLSRWTAALGGSWVATLPLLASFLDEPFEPSPYVPVSRLFWNELYIDVARAPGGSGDTQTVIPDGGDFVDYRCAAEVRGAALRAAARRFFDSGGERDARFRTWLERHPRAGEYAHFRALCDRFRAPWLSWPSAAGDRARGSTDTALPGSSWTGGAAAADVRFHAYAAWVADVQIHDIASAARAGDARLYLDLPLGVHPAGFDTWHEPRQFASGVSVGSPPDPFFRKGQNWGFPPLSPGAILDDGLRYVRDCLRHHLSCAGILRLDHAMSLERLFWIPDAMPAVEGVYVHYPQDELLSLLALEAHRHGTLLVGEDLGTVTPAIRNALDEHRVLRMYVAQFEFRPDADPPLAPPAHNVVASVNTHDLPPFAAFWEALDLEDQHALGLLDDAGLERGREDRARLRARLSEWAGRDALPMEADAEAAASGAGVYDERKARLALRSILDLLARSDAPIVIVNLEDLWLETRPQNVPGTTAERPNWKRRSKHDVASLIADAGVASALHQVDRERKRPDTRIES